MSYNGIGLTTPRGSGTNGYVQRNLSLVRQKPKFEDLKTLKPPPAKKANLDILDHQRRRQIEVEVLNYQEKLLDKGYSEEVVEERTEQLRQVLLAKLKEGTYLDDSKGLSETHELWLAKAAQDERARKAFGITNEFQEGRAFHRMSEKNDKFGGASLSFDSTTGEVIKPPKLVAKKYLDRVINSDEEEEIEKRRAARYEERKKEKVEEEEKAAKSAEKRAKQREIQRLLAKADRGELISRQQEERAKEEEKLRDQEREQRKNERIRERERRKERKNRSNSGSATDEGDARPRSSRDSRRGRESSKEKDKPDSEDRGRWRGGAESGVEDKPSSRERQERKKREAMRGDSGASGDEKQKPKRVRTAEATAGDVDGKVLITTDGEIPLSVHAKGVKSKKKKSASSSSSSSSSTSSSSSSSSSSEPEQAR